MIRRQLTSGHHPANLAALARLGTAFARPDTVQAGSGGDRERDGGAWPANFGTVTVASWISVIEGNAEGEAPENEARHEPEPRRGRILHTSANYPLITNSRTRCARPPILRRPPSERPLQTIEGNQADE
jgi:hypothetical protein